ncbi:MAG TPA: hypothetical protein DDX92_02800 [Flavobacteriales bacterium]|jgi:beta-lactam-binding protein with PASTA domain|nr:hypothetical protein [Flavobacteriales bacterium]
MSGFLHAFLTRRLWIHLLIILMFLIVLIFGIKILLDVKTRQNKQVRVPNLIGFHLTEIKGYLADKQVEYIISDSISDPYIERGVVVEQSPDSGMLVKPGRTIYLTINSVIKPQIPVPPLRDLTLRQALAKLKVYGLELDSVIFRPAECSNCVLSARHNDEELNSGSRIEKGAAIVLVVGAGEGSDEMPVPSVLSKSLEEAKLKLMNAGFNVGLIIFESDIKTGEDSAMSKVYRQIPGSDIDKSYRLGKSVDIYLTLDSNKIEDSLLNDTNAAPADTIP